MPTFHHQSIHHPIRWMYIANKIQQAAEVIYTFMWRKHHRVYNYVKLMKGGRVKSYSFTNRCERKQQLNVMYCIIGNYHHNNKMGYIGKVFRNVPEHLEVRKMECIVKKSKCNFNLSKRW